ncbi:MAG TPA: RDD family protein [Burkholderiales bacterium]|nr:RDD family protein [Burkholderiales bacterium]
MHEPNLASADFGGLRVRALALLADASIVFLVAGVLLAGADRYLGEAGLPAALVTAAVFAVFYWPALHASPLQATFGKVLARLRITGYQGERVSFLRSLGRELAKIPAGALFMLGFFMAGLTARKQALHDFFASTYVVREGEPRSALAVATIVVAFAMPVLLIPFLGSPALTGLIATMAQDLAALVREVRNGAVLLLSQQ